MYEVSVKHSGLCIRGDQSQMNQYFCDETNKKQVWKLERIHDNWYRFISVENDQSITIANTTNGSSIYLSEYVGSDNQLFRIEIADNEHYYIVSKNSIGSSLDISGVSNQEGGKLHVWSRNQNSNQRFLFTEVSGTILNTTEQAYKTAFEIYPNPSEGSTHIQVASPGKVKVYNLQGVFIREENVESDFILSGLLPGTYLVDYASGNIHQTRLLIVQ